MKPKFLGICGGTGSGKTYLANKILEIWGQDNVVIINQDSYYKDLAHMDYKNRIKQNFDHPDSIDIELLSSHLKKVMMGNKIKVPVYDFSNHIRLNKTESIQNCRIIIIEGIFALYYHQLRKLYTIKIFMDTSEKLRFQRRIERDTKERGRTLESVESQYYSSVKPMHKKFIEPSKLYADIIINGNNDIKNNIELIAPKINSILL
tara:strand:- start:45 stop:659 length:615 start_codon:yes stop_codon:yes gene_type:complete